MENDLISRSELLENYGLKDAVKYGNKTRGQAYHSVDTLMLYEIADMIESAPAVAAVPVVRCKDCKNFDSRNWYCYYWDYEPGSSPNRVDDDDFCSYGERKDDAK